MLVYTELFGGDELISDSFNRVAPFDKDSLKDCAFEVQTKWVTKGGENYGIADNTEEEEGGAAGGPGPTVEKVIDVVEKFKLQDVTPGSQKEFMMYMKGYLGAVKKHLEEKNPSRVEAFMNGCRDLIKEMSNGKTWSDFQIYHGENYFDQYDSCKAAPIISYYREGAETPCLIFIKDGLKEEKY